MANVDLIKVEERPGGQILFNVRVTATVGKVELPIVVKDHGSTASNETAVLRSTLGFAEELEASARLRLGVDRTRS
jgi:hypothetical protein